MALDLLGVAFIWTCFLWPLLVTLFYLGRKANRLERKGLFFLASVVVGYVALIFGNYVGALLFLPLLGVAGTDGNAVEALSNVLAVVALTTLLGVPVLTTHLLSLRFCRAPGAD